MPFPRLVEAAIAAQRKLSPPNPAALGLGGPRGIGWGPVVDGKILPQHPFDPAAPAISANVPMMIGTVMNESSPSAFNAALESMPEEEMKKRVSARYGDKTDRIVEAYRKAHPGAKPIESKVEELAALPEINPLSVEEVRQMTAIGDNTGCMTLKGASTRHLGQEPLGAQRGDGLGIRRLSHFAGRVGQIERRAQRSCAGDVTTSRPQQPHGRGGVRRRGDRELEVGGHVSRVRAAAAPLKRECPRRCCRSGSGSSRPRRSRS